MLRLTADVGTTSEVTIPTIALIEIDLQGVILHVNEACCALLGRGTDELVGADVRDITDPRDLDLTSRAIRQVAAAPGSRVTSEKRYLRKDGSSFWTRITGVNLDGRRLLGHIVDIEELVRTRERAEAAERRMAAMIEYSADIIAVIDGNGLLVEANPSGQRILGAHGDETGRNMLELIHPDDRAAATSALATTAREPGLHQEHVYRFKSYSGGDWVHLAMIGNNCLDDPAIGGIIINARDVTHVRRNLAGLVGTLIRATEYRDPYTAGHQGKVAKLSGLISRRLQLPPHETSTIELGASLHDIGKIAVPAEILTRPGRLTGPEFEIVKSHCEVGFDIITGASFTAEIADIVLHHHERLDGSGYPHQLQEGDLTLGSRVVAVADVVDAVSSHRPYRAGLGLDAARDELRSHRGRRYDREVVDAALDVLEDYAPGDAPTGADALLDP